MTLEGWCAGGRTEKPHATGEVRNFDNKVTGTITIHLGTFLLYSNMVNFKLLF